MRPRMPPSFPACCACCAAPARRCCHCAASDSRSLALSERGCAAPFAPSCFEPSRFPPSPGLFFVPESPLPSPSCCRAVPDRARASLSVRPVFGDTGVDLLRRHAFIAFQHQRAGGRDESVLDQQRIDRMVAGDVPAEPAAVLAARKMGERAVQCLIGQHELGLFHAQCIDVVGL